MDAELIQGTEEWRRARCGSLGASQIADALARTKSGWGASRANVMADLVVERLTGTPTQTYVSAAMQWGTQTEPEARTEYEFQKDAVIVPVGLIRHPTIKHTHASPDGLVAADGLIEVKCPLSATHIETLLGGAVPGKYQMQMQWQMACTGRRWCDFVSYDPRMPQKLKLFCERIARNDEEITRLEIEIAKFLHEVDDKLFALSEGYGLEIAA